MRGAGSAAAVANDSPDRRSELLGITYAFKCANCGALEEPQAAGENATPTACHVCGHGVSYDPVTGIRQLHPDNWIVLADMTPDEAAAHQEFYKHDGTVSFARWAPAAPAYPNLDREPQVVVVSAEETVGGEEAVS